MLDFIMAISAGSVSLAANARGPFEADFAFFCSGTFFRTAFVLFGTAT
jgi:hypothetical protein